MQDIGTDVVIEATRADANTGCPHLKSAGNPEKMLQRKYSRPLTSVNPLHPAGGENFQA
jgi:hypothetical protein